MHRNMARRARYTPSTPPHTAGTDAAGWPLARCGGAERGSPSTRPAGSCSSSSSSVICSAAYPLTVPRGKSVCIPASSLVNRWTPVRSSCLRLRHSASSSAFANSGGGGGAARPPCFLCAFSGVPSGVPSGSHSCAGGGSPSISAPFDRAVASAAIISERQLNRSSSEDQTHGRSHANALSSAGTLRSNAHTHRSRGPIELATRRETLRHFPHPSASHLTATSG